jgi:5-methyltetrahydrofolate--homocysteine methyltransferase
MNLLNVLSERLQDGDDGGVRELTHAALDAGLPPGDILNGALLSGMARVGERFRTREIFLPDVLLAARAMRAGMTVLQPLLVGSGVAPLGKIVLGTVNGDVHDIGKNLVAILLQGAGVEVIDLGTDVPPERFVDAAVDSGATLIGISALLTTTMTGMREIVDLVRERNLKDRIAIIVGGAPVTARFALEIGADAYASDAAGAVERVTTLLASR